MSEMTESRLRDLKEVLEATREFTPARLTVAREMAGLSLKDVADRVEVTPSAMSQFESGKASPKPETMIRLSLALGIPLEFLAAEPLPEIPLEACHFRSLRSTTVKERRQVIAYGRVIKRVVDYLRDLVEFPAEQLSALRAPAAGPGNLEACAIAVRDAWGLGQGPICDLVALLESKGAVPVEVPGHSERLDAFSVWVEELPIVFLASEKGSASRRRFDLAHELGHLLLHYGREAGGAEAEREADAFASALLLPREPFLAECPRRLDWMRLRQLKKRWGVSLAALVRRAYDLGLYTEATYRRAYMLLNQKGWRTNEPDEPVMERPTMLQRALGMVAQAGYPMRRIATDLGFGEALLEQLFWIKGPGTSVPAPG